MDLSHHPSPDPAAKSAKPGWGVQTFLVVLGLALMISSLFPLRLALSTLCQHLTMRSWREVPASIQFHDVRWLSFFQMLFVAVVFGGVGGMLFWMPFAYIRRQRAEQSLRERHPSEPWRWNPAWTAGRIRGHAHQSLVQYLVFAFLWNGLSWIVFIAGLGKLEREHFAPAFIALILFFPLIGLMVIGQTFLVWRSWCRMRAAELRLATLPGIIGGTLSGTLHLPCRRTPASAVKLTLKCVKPSRSIRRRSESVEHHNVLWDATIWVEPGAVSFREGRLIIPVLFQIPFKCQPTDPETKISWEVELEVNFGGTAVKASFPVPVFKTPASDPAFRPNPVLGAGFLHVPTPEEMMMAAGVRIQPLPGGGRCYFFRANRQPAVLFFPTFFSIPFVGVLACFLFSGGIPLFFQILIGLFLALTLWLLFDLWFWSARVDVTPHGVVCSGGVFFKSRQRHIPFGDIQGISLNGCTEICERQFFDLELKTTGGNRVKLGKRFTPRNVGEWLINEMERDLLTGAQTPADATGLRYG